LPRTRNLPRNLQVYACVLVIALCSPAAMVAAKKRRSGRSGRYKPGLFEGVGGIQAFLEAPGFV
jgi:hypothetical protein